MQLSLTFSLGLQQLHPLPCWHVPVQRKRFFHPRPYRGAPCCKRGHYTAFLPTPMFAWPLISRDSGKRQARCHQQMGCCYPANVSVGSIASLSIWTSVCPQVYLALLNRMLRTSAIFFFFLNMCMLLFLSITGKRSWLFSATYFGFSIWSPHVVFLPAVQLGLTNSMSRHRPALGSAHIAFHGKLTDENWRWRGPRSAFVSWCVYRRTRPPSRTVCSSAIPIPAASDLTCLQTGDCLLPLVGTKINLSLF